MNLSRLAFLTFAVLASWTAAAQPQPVTMWQVDGERNRVFLLGSVHLLRPEDHPLPTVIETAYNEADALYMELDMDDVNPAELQSLSNRLGLIQGEGTLEDVIGAERYAEAAALAEVLEIPFDMLGKTEPWFAAITIEQMVLLRIGFNPLYGIEMHMAMKASTDGKPIDGLETVEEQLNFLDGLSLDAQIDLLMQTLQEGGEIEPLMDELIAAWRHGDLAFLEATMLEGMGDSPELYETIVAERNRRWTDVIEDLLTRDDDYLVIVGALHLVGEDGLPTLLSERGIRIGQMHDSL